MKGILFTDFVDFVERELPAAAGQLGKDAYSPLGSYPEEELLALVARRQLGQDEPLAPRHGVSERRHACVGERTIGEIQAEKATAFRPRPEHPAHEEREVADVAQEVALTFGPGCRRTTAQHLDDAGEATPLEIVKTPKPFGPRELDEHVGQIGGDDMVAEPQLRARAARQGQEDGEQRRALSCRGLHHHAS
jgi:hypothetical protein